MLLPAALRWFFYCRFSTFVSGVAGHAVLLLVITYVTFLTSSSGHL